MLHHLFLYFPFICIQFYLFFFFNDTATTEIYTLSLHDALPIRRAPRRASSPAWRRSSRPRSGACTRSSDRKSTRLNSSHDQISYAVFCLKKKKLYLLIPSSVLRLHHRTR